MNYTIYHLHTELSLLDSCTNHKLYVDKAKEMGHTAICFTEHGNVYNWIEKKLYCEKQGLKYMHGVEIYMTQDDMCNPDKKRTRDNYHTILIARNYDGVKEINRLIDLSTQPSHMYYKPRITFDEFKAISSNVIKISACLASPLQRLRDEKLIQYYDYLEVQPHVNSQDQKEYNAWLYKMSIKHNKPLIAGTDTHSINTYKAECRSVLQEAKKIEFSNEDEFDLTMKSYKELVDMFWEQDVLPKKVYLEAIENTNRMAATVEEFELDYSFKYPPLYDDDEKVFKNRINTMYLDKVRCGIIKKNPEYCRRIREEMRVFKKLGMIGFMLFMSELVSWCWENGIPVGPCRGSVGGSVIAYITDIIDVDPLIWNTAFSRFCNEDRKEVGDIDIDISPTQRQQVYDYIVARFGEDKSAYILTIGTIAEKGTIDEIGRALANRWIKRHACEYEDTEEMEKHNPYSLKIVATIKQEYEEDSEAAKKKYSELFYYFDGLLHTAVSQSMHPAGIIASPVTLPDNYGTFWSEGKRILSINMEEVHEVSLIKYDVLGLKNLEVIKDCCSLAGIQYPKSHTIDWSDTGVWDDMIASSVGIFQFEGEYAFRLLQEFKPQKVDDLSLVNAALRPSGASYRDRLLAREINKNPSKIIDDLLVNSYGYLIYQEQTIAFLQDICGLSGSAADNIRRAIGRKQKDRLDAAMPSILEGYCKKSDKPQEVAELEVKAFLQIIEDSASYQFGRNHSTGYSMIGYICAYLRYYYPVEFIAAYLNNANGEPDIVAGTELAKIKGIAIRPIKFRYSKSNYHPDKDTNSIYKGVGSVKYVSSADAEALYELRNENFDSFIDFLAINPCNARSTEILIKLGFFEEFGGSKKLLDMVDVFNKFYGKTIIKKDKCAVPPEVMLQFATETLKQYRMYDSKGLVNFLCTTIADRDIPLKERLDAQCEFLGYLDYIDPEKKQFAYVLDVDTRYSPKITMHLLDEGRVVTYKVAKKLYQNNPINERDLLHIVTEDRNKTKKIEGGWEKLSEKETWIYNYSIY